MTSAIGYIAEDGVAIPEELGRQLDNYLQWGMPMGAFLTAVLSNQLLQTFAAADSLADPRYMAAIGAIFEFVTYQCPGACWTSEENVSNWIKRGGMSGVGRGVA